MAIVGSQSIAEAVPSAGLTDYSTYAGLPNGTSSAVATLNSLGVWRDPNAAGTVKPWVPIEMQDWTLQGSLHADSYTAGSPPSDWAEGLTSPGTITVHDGIVDVDSGSSTGGVAYLRWDTGSSWTTGHDIRMVIRVAETSEGGAGYFALRVVDDRSGLLARPGFLPSKASALRIENSLSGTSYGASGVDASTATKTWVIEHNCDGANDLTTIWSLEDQNQRAWCYGSDVAETSWVTYSGIEVNTAYSGSATAAFAVEWIAIYTKAR